MTLPPIANDYGAIAQHMARIARERLLAKFILPDGVMLVLHGSAAHLKLKQEQAQDVEMVLILRDKIIYLVKSRSGSFITTAKIDMFHYIATLLPSAKQTAATEITLSIADAARLVEILQSLNAAGA